VVEAHVIMRQVAHNIDQVKRKQEQQSRVKELSGILDGWLGPGKCGSHLSLFLATKTKPFPLTIYRAHCSGRAAPRGPADGAAQ